MHIFLFYFIVILLQNFWAEKWNHVLYMCSLFVGDVLLEFQLSSVSSFGSSFNVWGIGVYIATSAERTCMQKGFLLSLFKLVPNHWCLVLPLNLTRVTTFAAKCFHISPMALYWHKPHLHILGLQYGTAAQLFGHVILKRESWSQNYTEILYKKKINSGIRRKYAFFVDLISLIWHKTICDLGYWAM